MDICIGIDPICLSPFLDIQNSFEFNLEMEHGPFVGDFYENRLEVYKNDKIIYGFDEKEIEQLLNSDLNIFEEILSRAKKAEEITIWRRQNLFSYCNFLFLINALEPSKCKINEILLPKYTFFLDEIEADFKKNSINKNFRTLSEEEIKYYSEVWKNVIASDPKHLIFSNNDLIGINDDYFDDFILGSFDMNKMRTVDLIMKTWYNYTEKNVLSPDEWHIVNRIEILCNQGYIEKVRKSADGRDFDYVLRKTSKLNDYQKSINDFAIKEGYSGVWRAPTMWNEYTVYEPSMDWEYDETPQHYILVKNKEIRFSTSNELSCISKYIYPYNLDEFAGKKIYVLRRDGEEFYGTCKIRNDIDFGKEIEIFLTNGTIQIIGKHEIRCLDIICD